MPNSSPRRIPKYQLFKPRNLAKVRLDGRDIYLGPYDSPESHDRYKQVISEWLVHKLESPDKREEITICELMVCYLKHAGEYYVKDGQQTREFGCIREACKPLRQLYELTLVDEFGPLCLQVVRSAMVEQGWSRKYVNKQISRIRRMFRWGVSQELVKAESYHALRAVEDLRKGRTDAPDHEPVAPIDDRVVEVTMEELSPVVGDMVWFQRLTGCRPSEVCLLRPGSIDRTADVWLFRPDKHKTEHHEIQRIIHIGPKAQRIVWKYLLRSDDAFCFDPREAPGARRNSKERYTKDSYGRAVRRAVRRINKRRTEEQGDSAPLLELWSPNRLRHSAATEIRKEFGIEGAQVVLGHCSANVTEVYAERDRKLAEGIARKLG